MSRSINHIYEFGDFRLETAERLLLRGRTPIALTPKAFSTLLALVQSGGRLVEKHELIKQVWPDAVVEEANLARNVWALRKALGDGDEGHVYIETIPTVGYRFVAPVTKPSVEADGLGIEEKVGPRRIPDEPETPSVAAPRPTRW
jgi:DNA-binding winged helix-turn-helix (wHTH) protein